MDIKEYYHNFRTKVDFILESCYNLPHGNLPWVKKEKISQLPIAFYNKCNIYFDESSLPPSCTNVTDLSNKYIIYGIYCNGKFYIGKTSDFGERLSTHIKDSRSDKKTSQQLYKDMVECGECLVFIFCIVEDKETFDRLEHEIIKECKEFSIGLSCNFDQQKIKFITESIDDTKEYSLNYCYNIID
jgi:hypothetical protein